MSIRIRRYSIASQRSTERNSNYLLSDPTVERRLSINRLLLLYQWNSGREKIRFVKNNKSNLYEFYMNYNFSKRIFCNS